MLWLLLKKMMMIAAIFTEHSFSVRNCVEYFTWFILFISPSWWNYIPILQMVRCKSTIRTQNSKVIIVTQLNVDWMERMWQFQLLLLPCMSLCVCVFFLSFLSVFLEPTSTHVHENEPHTKKSPWHPAGLWGWWNESFLGEFRLWLLENSWLSSIPSSLRHRWLMDSPLHPPAAIMEIHLSCKLICNYDFGNRSKETRKGLIEWHFPMFPSPDKWDKTLQMCSDPRAQGRGCDLTGRRVLTSEM